MLCTLIEGETHLGLFAVLFITRSLLQIYGCFMTSFINSGRCSVTIFYNICTRTFISYDLVDQLEFLQYLLDHWSNHSYLSIVLIALFYLLYLKWQRIQLLTQDLVTITGATGSPSTILGLLAPAWSSLPPRRHHCPLIVRTITVPAAPHHRTAWFSLAGHLFPPFGHTCCVMSVMAAVFVTNQKPDIETRHGKLLDYYISTEKFLGKYSIVPRLQNKNVVL